MLRWGKSNKHLVHVKSMRIYKVKEILYSKYVCKHETVSTATLFVLNSRASRTWVHSSWLLVWAKTGNMTPSVSCWNKCWKRRLQVLFRPKQKMKLKLRLRWDQRPLGSPSCSCLFRAVCLPVLKYTESNTAVAISVIYHPLIDINVETTHHTVDTPVMNEVPLKDSLSDFENSFHFVSDCSLFRVLQTSWLALATLDSHQQHDCLTLSEKEADLLRTLIFPPTHDISLDLRVMSGRRRWAMSFTACGSVLLHIWIGKAEVSAGEQPGVVVSLNDLDHSFNQILHFIMRCV